MIYVVCDRNNLSGGSESLHQFASQLNKFGAEARMYYLKSDETSIPDKFKKYELQSDNKIVDSNENIIIVPETETQFLYKYKRAKKCIWWLSLDSYYGYTSIEGILRSAQRHNIPKFLYFLYFPVIFIKKKCTPHYFRFSKKDQGILHMYNCEYVRKYLKNRGISDSNLLYMCGPIRDEYFNAKVSKKENIIAYNPKKNFIFTKKVIGAISKERKDISFIPIEKMTPAQIVDLLAKCKVYIDFGQFPGPERIPREAVTMRCNIITSLYGSTRNSIDVPIPTKYKIAAKKKNIPHICETVYELLDNYEKHISEYDDYRAKVAHQKELLVTNTKQFISFMTNRGDN